MEGQYHRNPTSRSSRVRPFSRRIETLDVAGEMAPTFAKHSAKALVAVAAVFNGRLRKALGGKTSARPSAVTTHSNRPVLRRALERELHATIGVIHEAVERGLSSPDGHLPGVGGEV